MARIYKNITETIGKTPLVELNGIIKQNKLVVKLLGKVESFNPTGSVKDRIALAMICDAERRGLLDKDTVLIEPTSGNTGIGLAAVAAAKGYKLILTMPETMSIERRKILSAYGAKVILTSGNLGMKGAIEKAEEIAKKTKNSLILGQFINPANPLVHKETTGVEIWEDTLGKVDVFIAGVGTGGTISGAGEYLKSKNPKIEIVAVEPLESPVLSKGTSGPHGIQGIGAGFVPKTLNAKIYNEIIAVSTVDAIKTANMLARADGILAGISSGAALFAALQAAKKAKNKGKTIVVVLSDTGERYLL